MDRERFTRPIWDLDPKDAEFPCYDDYQALFMAAYEATFGLSASPARVRPYVLRYLRFYVVAPWVREFVRRAPARSTVAEELLGAPLDPVYDWRQLARRIAPRVLFLAGIASRAPRGPYLVA